MIQNMFLFDVPELALIGKVKKVGKKGRSKKGQKKKEDSWSSNQKKKDLTLEPYQVLQVQQA